jgi:hypothetical protein
VQINTALFAVMGNDKAIVNFTFRSMRSPHWASRISAAKPCSRTRREYGVAHIPGFAAQGQPCQFP